MSLQENSAVTVDLLMLPLGAAQLGGAERSIAELAIQLRRNGKRVLMLADRALEDSPYRHMLAAEDIQVEWVDWHPDHSHRQNFCEAWRVFKKYRAPIIQFNMAWRKKLWLVPLAAKLANPRAKLIATARGIPDPHHDLPRRYYFGLIPSLRLWLWRDKFNGWVWGKLLTRTVSVNRDDAPRRLPADFYFPADRIRVIQNGIPKRTHAFSAADKQRLRQQIGLPEGAVFILYAGRITLDKGIEVLLQAVADLPEHYHVVLLGDGEGVPAMQALSQSLKLAQRTHFPGFQSNSRDWMAAADIVAVPSVVNEGLARVVLEALGEQACIVATRVTGIAEIYEDEVQGLLIPPRDAKALTQALRRLGDDAALRKRFSVAAGQLFEEKYVVERVRDQYLALYAEVLSEN